MFIFAVLTFNPYQYKMSKYTLIIEYIDGYSQKTYWNTKTDVFWWVHFFDLTLATVTLINNFTNKEFINPKENTTL